MTNSTNKTILYYTGNFKDPVFSQKIRDNIIANTDLPIVKVTQKPTDFGRKVKSLYIGEMGPSYLNVYRQIQMGAMAIDTEYIVFCEDDFLYPPDYFTFDPPGGDFYRHDNTWMVLKRGPFYKTKPIGGAQIMKTEVCIKVLDEYLKDQPLFGNKRIRKPDYMGIDFELFTGNPIVAFKPDGNLSRSGSTINVTANELPIWGKVKELRKEYLG